MEQMMIALAALLGSSLTAAYVTNSWQKSRYLADALDDCARGVLKHHGLIRFHLGRAYSVLHSQNVLGGITDRQKDQIEEAAASGFEALASLDRERLRLVSLEPGKKEAMDEIMSNVVSAGKPVSSLLFSKSNNENSKTPNKVQLPGITVVQAMADMDAGQKQLSIDMGAFAMGVNQSRKSILGDAWGIGRRFWVPGVLVLLVVGYSYYQFGATNIVISGQQVYRYHRLKNELVLLTPVAAEEQHRKIDKPSQAQAESTEESSGITKEEDCISEEVQMVHEELPSPNDSSAND